MGWIRYRLAVLLGVLLLCGCTSGQPDPITAIGLSQTETANLQTLARAKQLQSKLRGAEAELIRRCAATKGFKYFSYTPTDPTFVSYLGLSPQAAAEQGYRGLLGRTAQADEVDAQSAAYDASLTQAQRDAYYKAIMGDPAAPPEKLVVAGELWSFPRAGCQAEAQLRLYGDLTAWNQAALTVGNTGRFLVPLEKQPEFKAVETRWKQCMKAANRPYDSVAAAFRAASQMSLDATGSWGPATANEKALALADANCRVETGLDSVSKLLIERGLAKFAAENEGEILKLIEILTQAELRARELLG